MCHNILWCHTTDLYGKNAVCLQYRCLCIFDANVLAYIHSFCGEWLSLQWSVIVIHYTVLIVREHVSAFLSLSICSFIFFFTYDVSMEWRKQVRHKISNTIIIPFKYDTRNKYIALLAANTRLSLIAFCYKKIENWYLIHVFKYVNHKVILCT